MTAKSKQKMPLCIFLDCEQLICCLTSFQAHNIKGQILQMVIIPWDMRMLELMFEMHVEFLL